MSPVLRVEADGTIVYTNYGRYKPVPVEERVYAKRRPEDPRAVRYRCDWYLPLDLLPDELRVMPETIPDEVAYDHMAKRGLCRCEVCSRPAAARWRRRYQREVLGIRPRKLS